MVDSRRLACWTPRPDRKSLSVQQENKGGDMVSLPPEDEGEVNCPPFLTRVPVDLARQACGLVLADVTRRGARLRAGVLSFHPSFVTRGLGDPGEIAYSTSSFQN